jgi:hypothetical protein
VKVGATSILQRKPKLQSGKSKEATSILKNLSYKSEQKQGGSHPFCKNLSCKAAKARKSLGYVHSEKTHGANNKTKRRKG